MDFIVSIYATNECVQHKLWFHNKEIMYLSFVENWINITNFECDNCAQALLNMIKELCVCATVQCPMHDDEGKPWISGPHSFVRNFELHYCENEMKFSDLALWSQGAFDLESAIRAIKCAHFGGILQNCDVFSFVLDLFDNDNVAPIWVFNLQCRLSDDTINVWPLWISHAVVCSCISAKAKHYRDGEFLKKSQDYGETSRIYLSFACTFDVRRWKILSNGLTPVNPGQLNDLHFYSVYPVISKCGCIFSTSKVNATNL